MTIDEWVRLARGRRDEAAQRLVEAVRIVVSRARYGRVRVDIDDVRASVVADVWARAMRATRLERLCTPLRAYVAVAARRHVAGRRARDVRRHDAERVHAQLLRDTSQAGSSEPPEHRRFEAAAPSDGHRLPRMPRHVVRSWSAARREVYRRLRRGQSQWAVARALGVSLDCVKKLSRVIRKQCGTVT